MKSLYIRNSAAVTASPSGIRDRSKRNSLWCRRTGKNSLSCSTERKKGKRETFRIESKSGRQRCTYTQMTLWCDSGSRGGQVHHMRLATAVPLGWSDLCSHHADTIIRFIFCAACFLFISDFVWSFCRLKVTGCLTSFWRQEGLDVASWLRLPVVLHKFWQRRCRYLHFMSWACEIYWQAILCENQAFCDWSV